MESGLSINTHKIEIASEYLNRKVRVDFYLPVIPSATVPVSLLLINDGQDLLKMNFQHILEKLYGSDALSPVLYAGIHCGPERKMEYGTAYVADYKGRGARAGEYTNFVFHELIPDIRYKFRIDTFREKVFAGFSLGGLSALDIVWNHPREFLKVGVFSGSFWWRSVDQHAENYNDGIHRIMHRQIRERHAAPWLKFFFECGALDETKDRNNNGVIDSIEDTLDLIEELKAKGYPDESIKYVELAGGKHDIPTWSSVFPDFLKWAFGNNSE